MEVRVAEERVRIPMTLRSISCEGAGVVLSDRSQRVRPGTPVTVTFHSGRDKFELPGRVAWCARAEQGSPRFDLGVRFHPARVALAHGVLGGRPDPRPVRLAA